MQNEYEIAEIINGIPIDLRVEVVVADLLQSGFETTDILVCPIGIFKRRFNKDIESAEVVEFNNHQQAVFVKTPRESIYDMLPQVLFHNPPSRNSLALKSASSMIEDYKKRVLEEKEARRFFSAYEIEFYKQRISNAIYEQKLIDSISFKMDNAEFLSYWGLPKIFNNRQKGILFYLFPVFHKIRGVIPYMQQVYEMILNQNISIEKTHFGKLEFNKHISGLGNMRLSADSCLSGGYDNFLDTIVIRVLNVLPEKITEYLPGSTNLKILNKLNDYFVPFFCETEISILAKQNPFILSETDKNSSRLGYSLTL
ncbi:MAG: hypothetical protein V9G42_04580 [Bacteroidia bacterium]